MKHCATHINSPFQQDLSDYPSAKLKKTPENRPSQKESSFPTTIFEVLLLMGTNPESAGRLLLKTLWWLLNLCHLLLNECGLSSNSYRLWNLLLDLSSLVAASRRGSGDRCCIVSKTALCFWKAGRWASSWNLDLTSLSSPLASRKTSFSKDLFLFCQIFHFCCNQFDMIGLSHYLQGFHTCQVF